MEKRIAKVNRYLVIVLCVAVLSALVPHIRAHAEETQQRVVRVGWYESSFNKTEKSGKKTGYAYEYQLKLASYSGWQYQYVSGSWPDLMQMLINGDIDLMSDVSFTEERADKMLFSDLPMGTEDYYIFMAPGSSQISADDITTLNGKKIGVNKGSVQAGMYRSWAQRNNVDAELVELTTSENESVNMLASGKLDAYITPNVHTDASRLVPVFKIGYSDFYFAVSKSRPELLSELNAAMSRIHDENPFFNQQMFEEHVQSYGSNAFLSVEEKSWLENHGKIRVGYQDNYLAFCARDPDTGELIGALKDFLENAENCFTDRHIDFEAIPYPTVEAAIEAMNRNEIDCVFPANFDYYDSEILNVLITPSLLRTDMYAVVRSADQKIFRSKEHVIVAVNEGNPNYESFVSDNYPDWRQVYYETTADCLKAVSDGVADCVIISSYRYNNISRLCEKYRLSTYSTGVTMDYYFAVPRGETELYSIIAKATGLVPSSTVNAALSFYVAQDAKMTLGDFIDDNIVVITAAVAAVLLIILLFLVRSIRSEKKARELIHSTETDKLTGLYNRDYFLWYADRIYREQPGISRDAIVINIEHFHSINALNGRDFGDMVLRCLGKEVSAIAKEHGGIGGRFGADRFDIYCRHLNGYRQLYDRLQSSLDALATNASIRIRMGVMPWQPKLEPIQLFDRARTACNLARGHYKEHMVVFDDKLHERELLEQRLLNDLRHALDNYEFEVYYQPKYDIESDEPRLIGAEALIRWQHPELGMLTPDSFIPLFEKNGKISEIDAYVCEQAARKVARWKAEFGFTVPVSINLSRIDIFDPQLESMLDKTIRSHGLTKDSIKLEVTETAYTENPDQVIQVVAALRESGYTVEMDDFGTGYSSLHMLSDMPVDVLKLDRTFICDIENSQKSVQLVALILGIAKTLNIRVVAEGVENEAQLKILKELGCTIVQGYYFSRPLHPSDFESNILLNTKR